MEAELGNITNAAYQISVRIVFEKPVDVKSLIAEAIENPQADDILWELVNICIGSMYEYYNQPPN